MRVEISKKSRRRLPYNYQYALASALYHAIGLEDPKLAESLHNDRTGKYFTFSWIDYRRGTAKGGLDFSEGWFYFSSPDHELVQIVAIGPLNHPEINVRGVSLEVTGLEVEESIKIGGTTRFRTLSPIYLKETLETAKGLRTWDLYPGDEGWAEALKGNLVGKYESYTGTSIGDPEFHVSRISRMERKRINIAGSYRRCAMLEFTAKSDPRLLKFGYEAGFGEKNSMGFGCDEVLT